MVYVDKNTFEKQAASIPMESRRQCEDIMEKIYREKPAHWPHGLSVAGHNGGLWLVRDADNDDAVGFVGWQERKEGFDKVGYYTIGVLPEHRKRGIAKKAVNEIISQKAAGVDKVKAFVVEGNTASEILAESIGVERVKQANKVYAGGVAALSDWLYNTLTGNDKGIVSNIPIIGAVADSVSLKPDFSRLGNLVLSPIMHSKLSPIGKVPGYTPSTFFKAPSWVFGNSGRNLKNHMWELGALSGTAAAKPYLAAKGSNWYTERQLKNLQKELTKAEIEKSKAETTYVKDKHYQTSRELDKDEYGALFEQLKNIGIRWKNPKNSQQVFDFPIPQILSSAKLPEDRFGWQLAKEISDLVGGPDKVRDALLRGGSYMKDEKGNAYVLPTAKDGKTYLWDSLQNTNWVPKSKARTQSVKSTPAAKTDKAPVNTASNNVVQTSPPPAGPTTESSEIAAAINDLTKALSSPKPPTKSEVPSISPKPDAGGPVEIGGKLDLDLFKKPTNFKEWLPWIAGALGLGGAGYLGWKAVRGLTDKLKDDSEGTVRVTLPTKDPNDKETVVDIPISKLNLSKTMRAQLARDFKRRLRSEGKERTRRRSKKEEEEERALLEETLMSNPELLELVNS